MTIPYQKNEGGLVALLPDGRVEFLHPAALPLLNAARLGSVEPLNFEDYILSSPLVRLDTIPSCGTGNCVYRNNQSLQFALPALLRVVGTDAAQRDDDRKNHRSTR